MGSTQSRVGSTHWILRIAQAVLELFILNMFPTTLLGEHGIQVTSIMQLCFSLVLNHLTPKKIFPDNRRDSKWWTPAVGHAGFGSFMAPL